MNSSGGNRSFGLWNLGKPHFLLIAVGVVTLLFSLYTFRAYDGNMAPLSTANILRITLIGTFITLLVFAHRDVFTIFRAVNSILVPITVVLVLTYIWLDAESADSLAREDLLIEDFSFMFLMAGAAAMGLAALLFFFRDRRKLAALFSIVLAAVFFVIAMEEVSWFQRVLGVESGEFFRQYNDQGETNFHNIYAHESEDLYYLGGFLLLVGLPYFRDSMVNVLRTFRLTSLEGMLPPYWLLGPFVLAGAFVAENFVSRGANVVIVLGSIIILAGAMERHYRRREWVQLTQMSLSLVLMLILVTYLLSVDFTGRDVRPWIGKEYQEFYIAWGLGAYAVSVLLGLLFRPKPSDEASELPHGLRSSESEIRD